MKKQQRVDELIQQTSQLQNDNKVIAQKIDAASHMFVGVANDNNVLRAQLSELTDRLHSLNNVLHIAEEVSGLAMDIPEIPDGLMEPWQLPCPMYQITASSDMFQC
jgi:seryl-tRNA synthetase